MKTFYAKPTPWLYMGLPLALLLMFFVLPTAMAFYISTLDYSHNIFNPQFVGLQNYGQLLSSDSFWRMTWNTLVLMIAIVPAMIILPIPLALLVNAPLKGITMFRALIYLPVVVSVVVTGIAFKWLYAPQGLINYGLSLLHIPPQPWLTSPRLALLAIAAMVVWKGLGYYMMMYLASLQSTSKELYEAAHVDGASWWQRHWHVTLPHLGPTMAMVATISVIGSLKIFTEIYVMTRGGPIGSTETFVYGIYEQAFGNLNLGVASALGILLMLLLLVLSWFNIKGLYLKAEAQAGQS